MRNKIMMAVIGLGLAGVGFVACSDDSDSTTPGNDAGGIFNNDGGPTDTQIVTGKDGGPVTDGGGDTAPIATCFSGVPTKHSEIINACPPVGTEVLDKAVTLPGGFKVGGTLPPLQ